VNSVRPIIEALERAHSHFNATLFGGRLTTCPVITVQTRGRKQALGWYSRAQWVNGAGTPAELNISAEDLKRAALDVLLTLAHEMVHQWADERHVKDCSRNGRYHNRQFARLATEAGLSAPSEPDKRLGFSAVTWGPEGSRGRLAVDGLVSTVEPALVLARAILPGKPSKGRMLLYVCECEPPYKVRCGKSDLNATCNVCEGAFVLAQPPGGGR